MMRTKKGFTLIEMILVISIIVIVTVAVAVGVGVYMDKSRNAAAAVSTHDVKYESAKTQISSLKFVGT